ncbi:hypothetical protein VUR80DRAFT_470 [Thermomyces stellatus]
MSPAIPQGVCLPYGERWQVFRARSGYAAPEHPLMSIWFPHRQVIPSCASKYYVPRTFSIILYGPRPSPPLYEFNQDGQARPDPWPPASRLPPLLRTVSSRSLVSIFQLPFPLISILFPL